jgi:hypothetical protein
MTLVPPRHPSATLSSALLKGFRQAIAFDTKVTSRTAPSVRRRLVSATSDISSNTQLDSMRAGAERHRASGGRSVVVEASGPADLPVAATLMPALTPAPSRCPRLDRADAQPPNDLREAIRSRRPVRRPARGSKPSI